MHTKISRRRRLNYKTAALAHCNTDKKLRNLSCSLVTLKETAERSRKSFLTSCNKTNVSFCINLLPFYRNSFTRCHLVSLFTFSISCFIFSIPGEIFLRVLCLFHGIDKIWRSSFLSSLFSHSCKICLIAGVSGQSMQGGGRCKQKIRKGPWKVWVLTCYYPMNQLW